MPAAGIRITEPKAFSSEVETGSRDENATKPTCTAKTKARPDQPGFFIRCFAA
jgi:hypothetical protein